MNLIRGKYLRQLHTRLIIIFTFINVFLKFMELLS